MTINFDSALLFLYGLKLSRASIYVFVFLSNIILFIYWRGACR